MQAAVVARVSLRRRIAQPNALRSHTLPMWAAPRLQTALNLPQTAPMSATAVQPNIVAAKAVAARLRRKSKKPAVVKVVHDKVGTPGPHQQKQTEEEALLAAASANHTQSVATLATDAAQAATITAEEGTATTATKSPSEKAKKKQKAPPAATELVIEKDVAISTSSVETAVEAASMPPANAPQPSAASAKKQAYKLALQADTEKITSTLMEIESLQKQLPSVEEVAALVAKLRRESFAKGQTLFDLYRIYGNPFLDENFLTPGVLACCEAKKPAQGIQIVRDMLEQGRKVEESTLRALLAVCDETSAAKEVIQLWSLMVQAGVKVTLQDLNKFLDIIHRKLYLDGALRVLKELRLHRAIHVHTYMFWLNQATLVWRADAFFDLLMEMRLSGVEPEIASLTSLESGRQDRALTVMEGVRAVGLDPCFAMSAVFSSMQLSVYGNGPAAQAITAGDVETARAKFGELPVVEIDWPTNPIAQVLETQAAGLILQQETFRRLSMTQVKHIDELLELLPITTNMTINLRKQLQRMSLLVNTHRIKRDARQIAREYDSGLSLVALSSTHNYPPVSLMRIILRERGLSTYGVKRALGSPSQHLSKRDQNELRKATGYDSIHRSDPFIGASAYNADSLEDTLTHFLKAKGIRLKTEEDLGQEQLVKYGRRVISPDILLLDPVVVNGTPIRWIDAKNYYGAHIVSKRLISRQLESYVKEWGPGAIVFGMGYSDMFSVPGVICLDTTPFPKTPTEMAKLRAKSMFQSLLARFSWKQHLGSDLTQEYPVGESARKVALPATAEEDDEGEDSDEDEPQLDQNQSKPQAKLSPPSSAPPADPKAPKP